MSEHHGVIRFSDNDVAATIILRSAELRLFSQDVEMGVWPVGAYRLVATKDGSSFTLHAEGEALTFVPNNAARLAAELEQLPDVTATQRAAAIDDDVPAPAGPAPQLETDDVSSHEVEVHEVAVTEGPAPTLLTRLLFYILLLATVATGVWAAVSLIN